MKPMEPSPGKLKERKFKSLADYLFKKILKESVIKNETEAEKQFQYDRIFDYFLDFSEKKDEPYRIRTLVKLQGLLQEKELDLPEKFKSYLSESVKKDTPKATGGSEKKWSIGNSPWTQELPGEGGDLLLMDEFDPYKPEHSTKKDRDPSESNYSKEDIENINRLAGNIFDFVIQKNSFFSIEKKIEDFLKKLFDKNKDRVSKKVFVEAVSESIKAVSLHLNNISNIRDGSRSTIEKKLKKCVQILERLLVIIKHYW